ncbi:pancreatic lipase-related protein 2-like [Ostrinia nubilalis]|uniref:pancreatic lipase-related protein 2-like n=1 Tax=Ostrinia nubilalis TaxID=29057 RepID=UPI00308252B2
MVGFKVALLLFCLAAASALPQQRADDDGWGEQPSWWPSAFPWPPAIPDPWPDQPVWWPNSIPYPPVPEEWPDKPEWWQDCASWPPVIPETLPPVCWPDILPWPPAIPEQWPDQQPDWWPSLPWPPAVTDQWPDQPSWWPSFLPWPPSPPMQWPDEPSWWPDSLTWPPTIPNDFTWPPQGVDANSIEYIPSRDNQFHLFTRNNQVVSQPLLIDNANILASSNYNASSRTVILIHGNGGSATDTFNSVMVPAFLAAGDVNVIVVDWSAGTNAGFFTTTFYSVLSGAFVSRFITFLVDQTAGSLANFHIVGFGIGALNAGYISRLLNAEIGYVTALDPAEGSNITNLLPPIYALQSQYTEVIHTDVDGGGYLPPLGDVDFYPNGGTNMPGCGGDSSCNRLRAVYYFAESIQTGGFTGVECSSHQEAISSTCSGAGSLNLGGLTPKTGSSGVFWVGTNAAPPFSQG